MEIYISINVGIRWQKFNLCTWFLRAMMMRQWFSGHKIGKKISIFRFGMQKKAISDLNGKHRNVDNKKIKRSKCKIEANKRWIAYKMNANTPVVMRLWITKWTIYYRVVFSINFLQQKLCNRSITCLLYAAEKKSKAISEIVCGSYVWHTLIAYPEFV